MAHECRDCGDAVHPKRYALGYRTCLKCGDREASSVRHCTVPMHKQGYSVVTNREELKMINPKRWSDGN